jgi:hypothetical protein
LIQFGLKWFTFFVGYNPITRFHNSSFAPSISGLAILLRESLTASALGVVRCYLPARSSKDNSSC